MAEASVAADHREPRARPCLAIARDIAVAALAVAVAGAATAGDDDTASPASASPAFPRGLVELKRQATGRGTPEETTKTNLKLDVFPVDRALSLLRLELPSLTTRRRSRAARSIPRSATSRRASAFVPSTSQGRS
jgi:hypothetical protein